MRKLRAVKVVGVKDDPAYTGPEPHGFVVDDADQSIVGRFPLWADAKMFVASANMLAALEGIRSFNDAKYAKGSRCDKAWRDVEQAIIEAGGGK